jgi:calcyclin binding protein
MSVAKQLEEATLDAAELKGLLDQATRDAVKSMLKKELDQLESRKVSLKKLLDTPPAGGGGEGGGEGGDSAPKINTALKSIQNYAWDQTPEFVKIYIDLPPEFSGDQSSIQLSFTGKRTVTLVFGGYRFSLSSLYKDVLEEGSSFKVTKSRIITYLKKKEKMNWTNIQESKNEYKKMLEEEKEGMAGDAADPSASLMNLMKKMYDEGDDEMKRTIAKSWYESRNKDPGGSSEGLDMGMMGM